jgi:hypothetical protein
MTPNQRAHKRFFRLVERDLQLRHVPFDKAELAAFLRSVWPLVEPGDRPARWAEAVPVALEVT